MRVLYYFLQASNILIEWARLLLLHSEILISKMSLTHGGKEKKLVIPLMRGSTEIFDNGRTQSFFNTLEFTHKMKGQNKMAA
jgi:hypothetical protein